MSKILTPSAHDSSSLHVFAARGGGGGSGVRAKLNSSKQPPRQHAFSRAKGNQEGEGAEDVAVAVAETEDISPPESLMGSGG
eukprot:CAMPEP_0194778660 /NCGR_PEP_ID=MMETSP0323_2-20130528/68808_1 /TAXON_ID=2866 ORGANISM="Crypthecodinium cohnii, Strain Seligo" /NCGR_SAMPLE_ID=MMETSP0323_2 /ASSEMBLY_ACC=CAM_ASM_000346 /LENGTH=81 /DNA_ID=CAMNT_0039715963 /DNA_START=299 /DNA_END=540 /DNA_ORIENTATION=-